MKIPFNKIPYLIILILLIVVTCQHGSKKVITERVEVLKVDTIYQYIEVHDTIPGKTIYISSTDSLGWINQRDFIPKTTYDSLKRQYISLGNSLFKTNVFETRFDIGDYGFVTVKDTISGNLLKSSNLYSSLVIPQKIITIHEQAEQKRQLYLGVILTGTKADVINSANIGLLWKDKRDRLFGGSIGTTPNGVQFGVQSYLKIKLKK